jgi:hypothetical protein
VKQRTVAPSSMPELYGQVLSRADLRDLVAFLGVLDGKLASDELGTDDSFGTSNRAMAPVTLPSKEGGHP